MTVGLFIGNAQSRRGNTVRNLSWKAAAWTGGAIIAAGGIGAAPGATAAAAVTSPPAPRPPPAVHLAARPAPPPPLRLLSVSPAAGSRGVDGGDHITVTVKQPLPAAAPPA